MARQLKSNEIPVKARVLVNITENKEVTMQVDVGSDERPLNVTQGEDPDGLVFKALITFGARDGKQLSSRLPLFDSVSETSIASIVKEIPAPPPRGQSLDDTIIAVLFLVFGIILGFGAAGYVTWGRWMERAQTSSSNITLREFSRMETEARNEDASL